MLSGEGRLRLEEAEALDSCDGTLDLIIRHRPTHMNLHPLGIHHRFAPRITNNTKLQDEQLGLRYMLTGKPLAFCRGNPSNLQRFLDSVVVYIFL